MRTFICIEIEEKTIKKISDLIEDLKKEEFDIKWVEEKNLHITLKFLGEVSLSTVEKISYILKKLKFNKFEIDFKGLGVFPDFSYPRVLFIGIEEGKENIINISKILDKEFSSLGFNREKNFSPHLTIGRIKSTKNKEKLLRLVKEKEKENFGKIEAEEIVLMKSTLTQKGPIYEPIEKFRLEKG